ncbi:TPA: restriction endonuclease subunit S [Bacillus cereus]|nr:restriction endonuclease subunit S [Bacillus cereus]
MSMMYKKYKIKDLAIVNPSKKAIKDLDPDTNVSFIPMEYVSNEGTILKMGIEKYKDVSKGFTYFEENDILFAKITPCMENGKGGLVKNLTNFVGFGSTEFHVIRANTDIIDPKYLYYIVHSKLFRKQAGSNMTGSAGQKRVPKQFIENYELNVPNKKIQLKIVELLDMMQTLITKRKETIAKLDELIQAVFLWMFGDLKYNSKKFEVGKLGDYTTHVSSGSTPKGGQSSYLDAGIPLIRSQNVLMHKLALDGVAFISNETHQNMKRSQLMHKDVLLNITGASIGRIAVYDGKDYGANVNQHVCIIRLVEDLDPYYVSYYIGSQKFQHEIKMLNTGATREALNYSQIKNFDIIIPPKKIQSDFKKVVQKINCQKTTMVKSLGDLELNFQSLLQKTFKGELDFNTEITA